MGDTTNTSTSKTGVNNAAVNSAITKLATGLSDAYSPGKSIYQAPGATTQQSWETALSAAQNPTFVNSLNGAIGSFGDVAAGKQLGMNDPGYAAIRSKLQNDVTTGVNSSFNNSGLFGSDSNQKALASGLADSLGALDYQQYNDSQTRQSQAAQMLPSLYSALQLPASVQGGVGAQQDAAANAQAAGPTDYLAKLTGILNGTAASAGTTTTNTTPGTPLWQSLLGAGIAFL